MEVRKIIFVATAGLLVVLTALLYMRATSESKSGASEEELAKAKSEYDRSQRVSSRTPVRAATPKPAASPSPRASTASPSPPRTSSSSAFSAAKSTAEKPRLARIPSPNADMIPSREPPIEGEPTWQQQLRSVNKLYDRKNYEEARSSALELLEKDPDNRRMLRVVVSSSCIMAEPDVAKTYYDKLPERDQTTMRRRCERYGVDELE